MKLLAVLMLVLESCRAIAAVEVARPGDRGAVVLELQQRLSRSGYWLGEPDGTYGARTTQAVYALQKAAGLDRDGIAGLRTMAALREGVRPVAFTTIGRAVEVDLGRQLLLLVRDGQVEQVFNASTGAKRTPTPRGAQPVYRAVDGWDAGPLGSLYRPRYFLGGIAVHGYPSVPPYPASHACVRVGLAAMDHILAGGWLEVGDLVIVG